MNLLTEAQTERRRILWKLGVWTTKDFKEIPIQQMSDEHIINVYNSLLKAAERELTKTVAFYASCPDPNGEMAQEAFEREYDYWLDASPLDILARHPFIPALRQEWSKRHPEDSR